MTKPIVPAIAMLTTVSTLVPAGIVVPCALIALTMESWVTNTNVNATPSTALATHSAAAAICIGRVQGVG